MTNRLLCTLAALLLLGFAAYEAAHDLTRTVWPGFNALADVLGAIYVPLWGLAGIGLLLRRRWGVLMSGPAALALALHGCLINMGGSNEGQPMIFGGIASLLLIATGRPWAHAVLRTSEPALPAEERRAA